MARGDDDDRDDAVWNAPWQRGHAPTPEERQEYADQWTLFLEQMLEYRLSKGDRKRLLWMAWGMIFSTEEFRDWYEAEKEDLESRQERDREAKNRRSRESRRRRKAKKTSGVH